MPPLTRSMTAPSGRAKAADEARSTVEDFRAFMDGLPWSPFSEQEGHAGSLSVQSSAETLPSTPSSQQHDQDGGAVTADDAPSKGDQGTSPRVKSAANRTMLRDKISFVGGMMIVFGTGWWLGRMPHLLYQPFSFLAIVLLTARFFVYRGAKTHYYLLDFCYIANLLSVIVLWLQPTLTGDSVPAPVFKVIFAYNAGPLLWSIPAMRNSLVLHSFDKITTLFIHIYPALVAYTLRWYPECHLQTCDKDGKVVDEYDHASFLQLGVYPMIPYLLWVVGYYFVLFVYSKKKIESKGYDTVYKYWMGSGHPAAQLILKLPEQLQPLGYLGIHCVLCWLTMMLSYVWWHSYVGHFAILALFSLNSVWNGATFYFDVFAHRYIRSLGIPLKPPKSKAKKQS